MIIEIILISLVLGFAIGVITGIVTYECPKCDCKCNDNKKQLLKG
jgi:hypothetical protein